MPKHGVILLLALCTLYMCQASLLAKLSDFNTRFGFSHNPATSNTRMWIFWTVNGDSVDFGVVGKTEGWVAVGLNPNAGSDLNSVIMQGASAVIGFQEGNTTTIGTYDLRQTPSRGADLTTTDFTNATFEKDTGFVSLTFTQNYTTAQVTTPQGWLAAYRTDTSLLSAHNTRYRDILTLSDGTGARVVSLCTNVTCNGTCNPDEANDCIPPPSAPVEPTSAVITTLAPIGPQNSGPIVDFLGVSGLTAEFTLETDTVTVQLEAPTTGYCAIAFGQQSMVGSVAIIGFLNGGTPSVQAWDLLARNAGDAAASAALTSSSPYTFVGTPTVETVGNNVRVTFTINRAFTFNSNAQTIDEGTNIVVAFGDVTNGQPQYHGFEGRNGGQITFVATPVAPVAPVAPTAPPVASDDDFLGVAGYRQSNTINGDEITITFSAPAEYVALGFSSSSPARMVGSVALVGYVSGGTGVLKTFALNAQSEAGVVEENGVFDVVSSTVTSVGGTTSVEVTLKTAYEFNGAQTISAASDIVVAYGNLRGSGDAPAQHSASNRAAGTLSGDAAPVDSLEISHGVLMFLSWGLLLPLGWMAARYLKFSDKKMCGFPYWWAIHRPLQIIAYVLSLIAFVIIVIAVADANAAQFSGGISKFHKPLGLIITILGAVQVLIAIFRPHPSEDGSKGLWRKIWEQKHHWLGRGLLAAAVPQIFSGIAELLTEDQDRDVWFYLYAVVVFIFVVAIVALEILRCRWSKKKKNSVEMG